MKNEKEMALIKQANMYLKGMSFRDIASLVGLSHVTVRDNITNKIKDINPSLYEEVLKKIDENSEKTINDPNIRNRVLASYKLLVENNKTVKEIATLLKESEYTIYRDLTIRLDKLKVEYPNLVSQDMVNNAKSILKKHSKDNLLSNKDSLNMNLLYKLYPSEDKRYRFIASCALTFGIRLEMLSSILGIEQDILKKNLFDYCPPLYDSIRRLFEHSMRDQDKAKKNFLIYMSEIEKTVKAKPLDKEKLIELLEFVSDSKALKFKNKHENTITITDDDILVLLNFQIKHTLGLTAMKQIFSISRACYSKRVYALRDKFPHLVLEFEAICDYYSRCYLKSKRAGR